MKSVHTNGGSPSIEKDDHQRKVPIGLDKSWESRRVEGLELMVSSFEQQKERQKKTCKPCSHSNYQSFANQSCCGSHHHHHHHQNHHHSNGIVADNGFVMSRHQEKTRSLSGSKKNKMSTTMSAPQKSLIYDDQTESSLVVRRQKPFHADAGHDGCLTPVNFKVRELEQQVLDLIHQLAQEKHQARQDKISLTKLQQQVARSKSEKPMKEMLMKELEQEKQRRELLEHKLKDRSVECCCRSETAALKKENTRLNEVVQDLLPYKSKVERMKQSTSSSAAIHEAELHRLRSKLESLEQDNSLTNMELRKLESVIRNCQECRSQLVGQVRLDGTPRSETDSVTSTPNDSDKTKVLLERLKNLEAEKSSLVLENEAQFRHYEKCLEDVTNQILDILVVQKTLKEESSHLKKRVAELEEENELLKKPQVTNCPMNVLLNDLDGSSNTGGVHHFKSVSFQPKDPNESRLVMARSVPFEKEPEEEEEEEYGDDDDDDDDDDGNYEGEGCQSSLSLNEILDSAAGSISSNTDGEEGTKAKIFSKEHFFASSSDMKEFERSGCADGGEVAGRMKKSLSSEEDANKKCCKDSEGECHKNSNVFVDMSASDSYALLGSCSCSHGQFIHLRGTSVQNSSDLNGNLVAKSESAPLHRSTKTSVADPAGTKRAVHRKIFRSDSGWKKFLPGCTSPQEEKDEGYLSNKTSEGSSDVGNHFASQIS